MRALLFACLFLVVEVIPTPLGTVMILSDGSEVSKLISQQAAAAKRFTD